VENVKDFCVNDEKKKKIVKIYDLGSVITNDAKCTREIKSRIAIAKAAIHRKKTFHHQIKLEDKEETSEVLHLEQSILRC
jgi:hypothetical protein